MIEITFKYRFFVSLENGESSAPFTLRKKIKVKESTVKRSLRSDAQFSVAKTAFHKWFASTVPGGHLVWYEVDLQQDSLLIEDGVSARAGRSKWNPN